MTKVAMSGARKDEKAKRSSTTRDLDERPRQGNAEPPIGLKDNVAEANAVEDSADSRRKLVANASKSPAEESEEERANKKKKH